MYHKYKCVPRSCCTKRPIKPERVKNVTFWNLSAKKLSHKGTASLQGIFSSVDEGSSRSSSIASSITSIASMGNTSMGNTSDSSVDVVVGVGHNGGSNSLLDNGLTGNRVGVGDVVGGIHVDGCGHTDDVLLVDRDIIGDIHTTLNKDGVLDIVDLNLFLDNGGVVGDRAPEDSGDRDGEMRGGRLDDPGGIARHEVGCSVVNLLGDNGCWLVHSGGAWALVGGAVWGRCWGCDIVDRVGHHSSSLEWVGGQGSGGY